MRNPFNFSAKYLRSIESKQLEKKKQNAVYVGLPKVKGKVDLKGRVSDPWRTKAKDAKQQIALLNDIFLEIRAMVEYQGMCFDIKGIDQVIDRDLHEVLKGWGIRSGLKDSRFLTNLMTGIKERK